VKLSTTLIAVGLLLIVLPIPILPPFVGAAVGVVLLLGGLALRLFDL